MNHNSARYQQRADRLNRQFLRAVREQNADGIVKNRFALLGYSYAEDDSGSGSALASLSAAAVSLGSAYIQSQAPQNAVAVPTRTQPAYGAAAPTSSNTLLFIGVGLVVVIGGLLFVMKG